MTDLTKEELEEKIAQVKKDLIRHQESNNPRMLLGLTEYIDYLESDLKNLDK